MKIHLFGFGENQIPTLPSSHRSPREHMLTNWHPSSWDGWKTSECDIIGLSRTRAHYVVPPISCPRERWKSSFESPCSSIQTLARIPSSQPRWMGWAQAFYHVALFLPSRASSSLILLFSPCFLRHGGFSLCVQFSPPKIYSERSGILIIVATVVLS